MSILFMLILALFTTTQVRAATDVSEANSGLIALTLRDPSSQLQIFTIHPDGTGQKQLTFEGDNGRPAWSRDGEKIAYISHKDDHMFVAVMDADGSNQKMLCDGMAPDWSPDDRTIAFSRDGQIWTIDADGTNQRQITNSQTAKAGPSWSHATNKIAFWSGIENRYGQIWVINSDGTGSRQLTDDPNHRNSDDPSWSPDDKKIIFSTGRSGRNELWIMDADGKNQKKLHDIDAAPFPGRATWQPA